MAKVLAEGVHERGAGIVFGMPGGGPNLDVVGAAGDAGLRFVLAHDEASACMMAGTYGLLTDRPALAIATRGPARPMLSTAPPRRRSTGSRCCSSPIVWEPATGPASAISASTSGRCSPR